MATFESMDRPLHPTPTADERRAWWEKNKSFGPTLEGWISRLPYNSSPTSSISFVTITWDGYLQVVRNGADGTGSGLKRNAAGDPVVRDGAGVELNGPAVN